MAEIYNFQPKAEKIDKKTSEENMAIGNLDTERFKFLMNFKKNNPANRHSDTYASAYLELNKDSNLKIAKMLNETTEEKIMIKPTYFIGVTNNTNE